MSTQKTWTPKAGEVDRSWFVVDAEGKTLGRLSSMIAQVLTGKHKPTWTPHHDTGDFVIVTNADKAVLTGNKEQQKLYRRHSGKPGNLREETAARLRVRRPTRMIELAVRGMLPKTRLGRAQLKKLKIYVGSEHPHAAQKPAELDLANVR